MIVVNFGTWHSSSGRCFTRTRIMWKGYKWTPFCRIRWRHGWPSIWAWFL